MFIAKNEQEKFNARMNNLMKELEELSYIEVLARIAAFNKQSKTFQLKISSKRESNLDEFIRDAGTIADETIYKFKQEILPFLKDKKNQVSETIQKTVKDVKEEIKKSESDKEIKLEKPSAIMRKESEPWTEEIINNFLKEVIRCRLDNGLYDQNKKKRISIKYSISRNNITNKANFFINQIIKLDKYPNVFSLDKSENPLTRAEILRFKFRDIKYCKELEKLPDYKMLSKEDKLLLKETIKNENKTKKN